jgi:hypothetical protein
VARANYFHANFPPILIGLFSVPLRMVWVIVHPQQGVVACKWGGSLFIHAPSWFGFHMCLSGWGLSYTRDQGYKRKQIWDFMWSWLAIWSHDHERSQVKSSRPLSQDIELCSVGTFHNTYEYMWVHKRGFKLNFVILHIHMLHKLQLVVMYMYEGPLENVQHLYLYDNVVVLYGTSI